MFGYIRPLEGELLVREYEVYRAVYCSLCRTGGRRISRFSRFFLNYDFVFLALLRLALSRSELKAEKAFCPYRLKKKNFIAENDEIVYTTAAFGILSYYKLKDDIADLRGPRRFFKRLVLPLFARMRKRAAAIYPQLDARISSALDSFGETERSAGASVDQAADGFAAVTRIIASFGLEGPAREIADVCGYHIGRYVYIIDAFDDCREDEKRGEYNCLNMRYGSSALSESQEALIGQTLRDSMAAFSRAYALADGCALDNIIYNIAALGSEAAFNRIRQKRKA